MISEASNATTPNRARYAAWLALSLAVLALLALQFTGSFASVPNMASPGNGTPWAPHSDALGPWLEGGLAFLFGLPPSHFLYRPTIGVFWGALLGATGRVEMIPMFFLAWLLAAAIAVLVAADRPLRHASLILFGFAAMRFPQTWHYVGFDVDLAALALTFTGAALLLWDSGKASRLALLAGCACLGVAAAIRGPMLLAGPIAIAIRVMLVDRAAARALLIPLGIFAAPVAIDIVLQKSFGTINNGLLGLFCTYSDPRHGWTPACKALYERYTPHAAEIFQGFLAFRLSGEGLRLLAAQVAQRTAMDLLLVYSPATQVLIAGVAALASARRAGDRRSFTPFVKAIAVIATLAVVWRAGGSALAWIVLAVGVAIATRHWRALLCLATYLGGVLFLGLLGLPDFDRFFHTFGFTLVLGIGFLVVEEAREPRIASTGSALACAALASAACAALLFLYLGSTLGSEQGERYRREVYQHPNRAMKIGDHAAIDRSLYYLGDRRLVYTRHDERRVGEVRGYGSLATDFAYNKSYATPNAFRD